ncbi:MAG: hypothetical protein JWM68_4282 [Verrucomicrobiales bacterium]|nr:hypothetical protein [Verrucomicrobiales bacterium]
MKTLLLLLIVIGLGLGIYWYYNNPDADQRLKSARSQMSNGVEEARSKVSETFSNIDTDQIKDELARTGRVVRKKTEEAGEKIVDATADARVTAAIKTKLARDPDLSALSISVNTTQGKVTLSGTVASHALIKRAIDLALQTDGASEVVSTLQVKN